MPSAAPPAWRSVRNNALVLPQSARPARACRSGLAPETSAVPLSAPEAWTLRRFSELYYAGPAAGARPFEDTHWMGVPALKCPLDLWVYQELLFRLRPGLIVETGTRHGGTALYLAHLCDLLGRGRVASVDIEALPRPQHPRIRYIKGSSTDPGIVGAVAAMTRLARNRA